MVDIFIIKEELIHNLCTGLSGHIVDGFTSMLEDAKRISPYKTLEQMKLFLLDVENWSDDIIINETRRILMHFPSIHKVLKTINYINIKSLSLIGRHDMIIDDHYILSKTPKTSVFIHKVYMYAAKEFFHDESLFDSSKGMRSRQNAVIRDVLKQILNECVPIDDLLSKITDHELLQITSTQQHTHTKNNDEQVETKNDEEDIDDYDEDNDDIEDNSVYYEDDDDEEDDKDDKDEEYDDYDDNKNKMSKNKNNDDTVQIMLQSTIEDKNTNNTFLNTINTNNSMYTEEQNEDDDDITFESAPSKINTNTEKKKKIDKNTLSTRRNKRIVTSTKPIKKPKPRENNTK